MGSNNPVLQRKRIEGLKRFSEGFLGKKNTSAIVFVFAALIFVIAGWLPDGLSENIDFLFGEKRGWTFNYKLTGSIAALFIFWLLLRKTAIFGGRIEADSEQPQPVRVLGLFLSPFRVVPDIPPPENQVRTRDELKTLLFEGVPKPEQFVGTTWEMPLKALGFHCSLLRKVYLITSSGSNGTSAESELFVSLANALYSDITIEEFAAGGLDFEDVKAVFSSVESLYQRAKKEGYREQDVLIDITGGQKTNSIAAAIATLATGRKFQYIGKKSGLLSYDVGYFDDHQDRQA
jgi:hypothetical protein